MKLGQWLFKALGFEAQVLRVIAEVDAQKAAQEAAFREARAARVEEISSRYRHAFPESVLAAKGHEGQATRAARVESRLVEAEREKRARRREQESEGPSTHRPERIPRTQSEA